MAERSPKHQLSKNGRGWYKRVNGEWKHIVSNKLCPTGEAADDFYERNFVALWQPPAPAADPSDFSVSLLCDAYLGVKRAKREVGKMERLSFFLLARTLQSFCDAIGPGAPARTLGPADFARVAKAWSKAALSQQRSRGIMVRSLFRWAAKPPVSLPAPDFGEVFALPTRAQMRRDRQEREVSHGPAYFTPEEVRAQLAGTTVKRSNGRPLPVRLSPLMRAVVLLGVNAGFGPRDCGTVPVAAFDLDGGWVTYPRTKTGAARRAKLWPETVAAVRAYLEVRHRARRPEWAKLMFRSRTGGALVRYIDRPDEEVERYDQLARNYRRFLGHMKQRRPGVGLYALRRTFRSIAAETGQELAADTVMGHAGDGDNMGRAYTRWVLDEKLELVANHVRSRIFNLGSSA